jgi:hypothetical protein
MTLGKRLRTRRGGSGGGWSGDACVALVPPPMGDASVPSLHPCYPRPYETMPLPSSFQTNLPVKAIRDRPYYIGRGMLVSLGVKGISTLGF